MDQADELRPGEKKYLAVAQGLGVGRKGVAMKDRYLAKRLASPEDVQDLLAAVKGGLEDLHLAAGHHVETDPRFPLKKDSRPLGVALADGNLGHFAELVLGQAAEEQALGEQFIFFVHDSK